VRELRCLVIALITFGPAVFARPLLRNH